MTTTSRTIEMTCVGVEPWPEGEWFELRTTESGIGAIGVCLPAGAMTVTHTYRVTFEHDAVEAQP